MKNQYNQISILILMLPHCLAHRPGVVAVVAVVVT